MAGAEIAFDGCDMIHEIGFVFFSIGSAAHESILFVHPCDHTDGSPRSESQPVDQLSDLHRDCDARTVINRACAEVPRVQMTRNSDDLLGMLGALYVRNDIVALNVRQRLRR